MIPASYAITPSRNFAAAAPSDATPQPECRWVLCLTDGNLVATNAGDAELTIPLTAGQYLPITPKLIKTTSTGTYALLR